MSIFMWVSCCEHDYYNKHTSGYQLYSFVPIHASEEGNYKNLEAGKILNAQNKEIKQKYKIT